MNNTSTHQDDPAQQLQDLNALIVNCPELRELERLLGSFNVFRVLGAKYHELHHSNMLAWLLQPNESHGLMDLFLRRWLMRVLNDADEIEGLSPDPADIDVTQFVKTQVLREWSYIDLLIILETLEGDQWVVAIENKVRATQEKGQLAGYRKTIEEAFAQAKYRIFIFLTKNREKPKDPAYISANYSQVLEVLKECIDERRENIGVEPNVLLKHYQEILKEAFMDDSRVADLARKIYQTHRNAMDVIIEHKPDPVYELSESLLQKLRDSASQLNIATVVSGKGYVRFIPLEWDTAANRQGKAWGKKDSCYILYELELWGGRPILKFVESGAPKVWEDRLWDRSKKEPFTVPKNRNRPKQWLTVFSKPCSKVSLVDKEELDVEETANAILEWIKKQMDSARFVEARNIVAQFLQDLEQELNRPKALSNEN